MGKETGLVGQDKKADKVMGSELDEYDFPVGEHRDETHCNVQRIYANWTGKERHREIDGPLRRHSRTGGPRIEYTSQNRVSPLIVDTEIWTFRRLVKLENHQLFECFMLHIREIVDIVTNVNY